MYKNTKRLMWFLVGVVAVWILLMPWICRADTIRPWTEGEKTVLVWSCLAVIADMYTTCRFLDNPYNYETNPYLGKHPSDSAVIITLSLSHLALLAISHWVPEINLPIVGKINTRYSLLGTKATLNTYFTINNTTLY